MAMTTSSSIKVKAQVGAGAEPSLLTHDARFDGVFFVGISTTRIYCRTVCAARTPRLDRCTFYPSAAAAEGAGYRPCLRCRPELAPGLSRLDSADRLASDAAARIEAGALAEGGVVGLAQEMGASERYLRRIIAQELGVSPVALAQTQRLLLAKRLLTGTLYSPWPTPWSPARSLWNRAAMPGRRWHGSGHCLASASGPRSISPRAPWPSRMPFRTRIWGSRRRWAGPRRNASWRRRIAGARGGLMRRCTCGNRWKGRPPAPLMGE